MFWKFVKGMPPPLVASWGATILFMLLMFDNRSQCSTRSSNTLKRSMILKHNDTKDQVTTFSITNLQLAIGMNHFIRFSSSRLSCDFLLQYFPQTLDVPQCPSGVLKKLFCTHTHKVTFWNSGRSACARVGYNLARLSSSELKLCVAWDEHAPIWARKTLKTKHHWRHSSGKQLTVIMGGSPLVRSRHP